MLPARDVRSSNTANVSSKRRSIAAMVFGRHGPPPGPPAGE
jgi:hypothetical protein